jgi:hypothetical protein
MPLDKQCTAIATKGKYQELNLQYPQRMFTAVGPNVTKWMAIPCSYLVTTYTDLLVRMRLTSVQ